MNITLLVIAVITTAASVFFAVRDYVKSVKQIKKAES